jgi:hypothetical protein
MPVLTEPQPDWTALKSSLEGRVVQIKWSESAASGCGQVGHIYVLETHSEVVIGFTEQFLPLAAGHSCPSAARNVSTKIQLEAPLGKRQLKRIP